MLYLVRLFLVLFYDHNGNNEIVPLDSGDPFVSLVFLWHINCTNSGLVVGMNICQGLCMFVCAW